METGKKYSLAEIGGLIGKEELHCDCGRVIQAGDVDRWGPHDGGIEIEGFAEKQWVFFHCAKCGYDWSLVKLLHKVEAKRAGGTSLRY